MGGRTVARHWLLGAACAVGLAAAAPAPSHATQPADQELLSRAADYVRRFQRAMSTIVLEERYVQVIKPWMLPPERPDEAHLLWFDDVSDVRPDAIVAQRRQTKSDLLLVQLPDQRWTAFRDTFEVNGRLERHREDRLRKLFLEQTENSRRQMRRIHERSAEWNLGGFYREINLPTTGLLVAHPRYQAHFAFTMAGMTRRVEADCRIVSFRETSTPTLVQSVRGRNVPLKGHLCIDAAGAVWSTRLELEPRYTTRGAMEVTYGRDDRLDVLVPKRMWEWYVLPEPDTGGQPAYVEALATYSNLRQFTVTTSETVKP